MKKQIFSFIFLLCITSINLHAVIIKSHSMGSIANQIMQKIINRKQLKTLVILDLDDTTFHPHNETREGSNRWFYKLVAQEKRNGIEHEEAMQKCLEIWWNRQESEIVRAVEPDIVTFISWLQSNNIPHTGITARSPVVAAQTIRQLEEIRVFNAETQQYDIHSISFENTAPQLHCPITLKDTHFESGVHFIGNGSKGDMCNEILLNITEKPDEIIMIDDGKKHLELTELAVQKHGIVFTGYHYTYFEELERQAHKQQS